MFTSIGFFILVFIISIGVLLKASDWFVDSAEKIGLSFGVSPFIIGVTIVAFGTSLPELATSISAVLSGSSEIVIGNVVGSNIANILLVLGLSALIGKKILMDRDVMESEMPQLLGSALFIWFVLQDFRVSLIESILFLVATVAFMANFFTVQNPLREGEIRIPAKWKDYLLLIGGGALVYFSSNYAIVAVQEISVLAGIDTEFLALSLVAIGTSLPEVFVSVTAARKGKHGIAIGNVLGSNIFNTYLVTAVSSFFGVLVIPEHMLQFAVPFMVAITFLFALVALRLRIGRWEGVMMLLLFAFYMVELGKAATTAG
jgi:cation:H+ antiporter